MVVEDKKSEKMCSFYVSDFHLEMILVPYINKKIEKKENVIIATERNLKGTVEELISKVNLKEKSKEKILNLDWNNNKIENLQDKSNVIIIGTENYIKNTNEKIKKFKFNEVNIVDCYNFEEVKENMNSIIKSYDQNLNTLGINEL